jgi:hypothetical protein
VAKQLDEGIDTLVSVKVTRAVLGRGHSAHLRFLLAVLAIVSIVVAPHEHGTIRKPSIAWPPKTLSPQQKRKTRLARADRWKRTKAAGERRVSGWAQRHGWSFYYDRIPEN